MRSFRRNLASSSSKPPAAEPHHGAGGKADCSIYKGRFVKINMDGVPIGRKVELKEDGSYADLSATVDKLFRSLLAGTDTYPHTPCIIDLTLSVSLVLSWSHSCQCFLPVHVAQRDAAAAPDAIAGGEYTLVYEDDEGDRMLVGDVPWQ